MKNNTLSGYILSGGFALLLSTAFSSCDNVAADDRYLLVDPVVPARVLLIEDFTGQNCVNCPDAHTIIEELQKQYGDAIVAVSIHGGSFSISREKSDLESGYIGLATPEGEHYNTIFNVSSWPQGMIDRRDGLLDFSSWASAVRKEIERPADLSILLNASLENGGKEIKIDVELIPNEEIEGDLNIWVIESGITARQRSSNGLIAEYVHENVFRAAVNGTDGETVSLSPGLHHTGSYTIEVRDNNEECWNPENLSVVAFVSSSAGVHQTACTEVE